MNIEFSPDIQHYINQQVAAGVFATPEEMLSAAVLQMRAEPLVHWTKEALARELAIGLAEADRGEFVNQSIDEIYEEWEKEYSHNR